MLTSTALLILLLLQFSLIPYKLHTIRNQQVFQFKFQTPMYESLGKMLMF